MPQYVYFIRAFGTNRYKIGISEHPAKRLIEMQVGSPIDLELVNKIECRDASLAEAKVHNHLKDLHSHGEWFDLADDDYEKVVTELEKFERSEPSVLDTAKQDKPTKRNNHTHRIKGTKWVSFVCLDCQKTQWAGDESQSYINKVCFDCWSHKKSAAMDEFYKTLRINDDRPELAQETLDKMANSPGKKLVRRGVGLYTTPETLMHTVALIGKIPDWYCPNKTLYSLVKQGKIKRRNVKEDYWKDEYELVEQK